MLARVMLTDCPPGTPLSVAETDAARPIVRPDGTATDSTGAVVLAKVPAVVVAAVGVVVAGDVVVAVDVVVGVAVAVVILALLVVTAAAGAAAAAASATSTAVLAAPMTPRRSTEVARRRSGLAIPRRTPGPEPASPPRSREGGELAAEDATQGMGGTGAWEAVTVVGVRRSIPRRGPVRR
jgi:hypothetical protein